MFFPQSIQSLAAVEEALNKLYLILYHLDVNLMGGPAATCGITRVS
jgi:hypothetical protein